MLKWTPIIIRCNLNIRAALCSTTVRSCLSLRKLSKTDDHCFNLMAETFRIKSNESFVLVMTAGEKEVIVCLLGGKRGRDCAVRSAQVRIYSRLLRASSRLLNEGGISGLYPESFVDVFWQRRRRRRVTSIWLAWASSRMNTWLRMGSGA